MNVQGAEKWTVQDISKLKTGAKKILEICFLTTPVWMFLILYWFQTVSRAVRPFILDIVKTSWNLIQNVTEILHRLCFGSLRFCQCGTWSVWQTKESRAFSQKKIKSLKHTLTTKPGPKEMQETWQESFSHTHLEMIKPEIKQVYVVVVVTVFMFVGGHDVSLIYYFKSLML